MGEDIPSQGKYPSVENLTADAMMQMDKALTLARNIGVTEPGLSGSGLLNLECRGGLKEGIIHIPTLTEDMTDMILSMWRQAASKKTEEEKGEEAAKKKAEAIMKELEEKRKAVKSYRAEVTQEMQMMGAAMATHTTEWVRKDKRRMDATNPMMPFYTTIGTLTCNKRYHGCELFRII